MAMFIRVECRTPAGRQNRIGTERAEIVSMFEAYGETGEFVLTDRETAKYDQLDARKWRRFSGP